MLDKTSLLAGARGLEQVLGAQRLPEMMPFVRQLWPICRSITGPGVRLTLDMIGERIELKRFSTPSGSTVFDWTVPPEWRINDAYIQNESGQKVIDFQKNNLHVVQYSEPVSVELSLQDLQSRLHSLPEQPTAIPYLASYYRPTWGFCISHEQRQALRPGHYRCVIDSEFVPDGQLDFAQCYLSGQEPAEIFFSSYVCHPSMANNELSGPVVQSAIFKILTELPSRRLSYRGAFTTETIGTLCFLQRFGADLKKSVAGGSVLTCVGDDGPFTFIRSRRETSESDAVYVHVLAHASDGHEVNIRRWQPVGSDERQYCSPGFDLPVGSFSRSRFEEFKEYHTSLDDLYFVSEAGLQRSLRFLLRVCQVFEMNLYPQRVNPYGEPQLDKRGLYASDRTTVNRSTTDILFILGYADGKHSMVEIAELAGRPIWAMLGPLEDLVKANLVKLGQERIT